MVKGEGNDIIVLVTAQIYDIQTDFQEKSGGQVDGMNQFYLLKVSVAQLIPCQEVEVIEINLFLTQTFIFKHTFLKQLMYVDIVKY